MEQSTIKVTVLFENPFFVAIFERNDDKGYAVARQVFGDEPSDPELYEFVASHFYVLNFSKPNNNIKLIIKRKNFKRISREVRQEVKKHVSVKKESKAQEALRLELEAHKKLKKKISKAAKEAHLQRKFDLRQEKKKKKMRGH